MDAMGILDSFTIDTYSRTLKVIQDEVLNKSSLIQKSRDQKSQEAKLMKVLEQICDASFVASEERLKEARLKLDGMSSQLFKIRKEFKAKVKLEKEKKANMKEQRDFSIFDNMGYKFNTKVYTLKEKHPMSRVRF
jgi:hypothetical protein